MTYVPIDTTPTTYIYLRCKFFDTAFDVSRLPNGTKIRFSKCDWLPGGMLNGAYKVAHGKLKRRLLLSLFLLKVYEPLYDFLGDKR